MKNMKFWRTALVATLVLTVMLSVTGGTIAWFTDSVSSEVNTITAGNLDVELYYQLNGQEDWTKVDASTNVFKPDTLWEPGHTEVVKLKMVNEGSLALKAKLGVNVVSETVSTNVNGDEFELSDHIKYGIGDASVAFDRAAAIAAVENVAVALGTSYTSEYISLAAEAEKIVTMVVFMPTTVGNEANYAKNAAVPTINLGVKLEAIQDTVEKDSFDNMYDVGAVGEYSVSSADELAAALEKGGALKLTADITLTDGESLTIPEGSTVVMDMNGKTLTNPVKAMAALVNKGTLVVEGGTIVNENIEAQGAAVIHNYGDLVLNNVNVGSDLNRGAAVQNKGGNVTVNGGFFATMTRAHSSNGYAYVFINNSGTMTINNAEVDGYPNGIFFADAGSIEVNGGSYKIKDGGNTWYVAYAGGDSVIKLNSGTYHWYKLYCDAATTGNVIISDDCDINWSK